MFKLNPWIIAILLILVGTIVGYGGSLLFDPLYLVIVIGILGVIILFNIPSHNVPKWESHQPVRSETGEVTFVENPMHESVNMMRQFFSDLMSTLITLFGIFLFWIGTVIGVSLYQEMLIVLLVSAGWPICSIAVGWVLVAIRKLF